MAAQRYQSNPSAMWLSVCISRERDWSEWTITITGHFFVVVFLQVSVKSTPEGSNWTDVLWSTWA